MNTKLSKEQIETYQCDGFLLHRNFLSPDEVLELKTAELETLDEVKRTMGKKKIVGGNEWMKEGDSYYDTVFTQRVNLWRLSPVVKRYMQNPELGRMLCELEGVDGYRVSQDQLLIKEPFSNPTGWHLDNVFGHYTSWHSIAVWIALEDATLENGCMWYVPGSKRFAKHDTNVSITQNLGDLFKAFPEMLQANPVPVPAKAGDCIFHNGMTAHGAGANMGHTRRIAAAGHYMPIGSLSNGKQGILPAEYFKTLKAGDVLENDDWNPVVYVKEQL